MRFPCILFDKIQPDPCGLFELLATLAAVPAIVTPAAAQQPRKANILVIMGDDIGYWNISAYNCGGARKRSTGSFCGFHPR
jgi:hypothetical protein